MSIPGKNRSEGELPTRAVPESPTTTRTAKNKGGAYRTDGVDISGNATDNDTVALRRMANGWNTR